MSLRHGTLVAEHVFESDRTVGIVFRNDIDISLRNVPNLSNVV